MILFAVTALVLFTLLGLPLFAAILSGAMIRTLEQRR